MTMVNGERLFTGNHIIGLDTGAEYVVISSGLKSAYMRRVGADGTQTGPLVCVEAYDSDRYTRKV